MYSEPVLLVGVIALAVVLFIAYRLSPYYYWGCYRPEVAVEDMGDEPYTLGVGSKVFGNVTASNELQITLTEAFQDLDKILVEHSGPFAANAVIGSKWRQNNDVDEFTKDGISILRHLLVSEDPTARFAARLTRFVGITVDKRCHDGTTTSMLLFCRLALLAISKMAQSDLSLDRYKHYWEFYKAVSMCLAYLDSLKIEEDDIHFISPEGTAIEDVRGAMAYHMAMISSKGDSDLARKIATVIKQSPKKIYGMFKNAPLLTETEEPYILKQQPYDLGAQANIGNLNDYNHLNDTQFLSEKAVIFATGNEIVTHSLEAMFLTSFISEEPKFRANLGEFGTELGWENFHEGKRNLIILSPTLADGNLIASINVFNRNNPNIKIVWFNTQIKGRVRTSFNKTLHYMAGVPLFTECTHEDATQSLIGLKDLDVKVHLLGYSLAISNLYVKDGGTYHPLYRNPGAFESYTEFCKETEDLIEFANNNIANPLLDQDELTDIISLYRALTCQEIWDIEVGGSVHDQRANMTVYEDAMGAALSAVNEGVVLGGYGHFATHFNYLAQKLGNPLLEEFRETFLSIVADSLRTDIDDPMLNEFLFPEQNERGVTDAYLTDMYVDGRWSYVAADVSIVRDRNSVEPYIKQYSLNRENIGSFLAMDNELFLLQAYGGYHEQFKRIRDILPRLANTANLADMRLKDGSDVQ